MGEQAPVTPMRGQADREEEKNYWEDGDEEDDYSSVLVKREHGWRGLTTHCEIVPRGKLPFSFSSSPSSESASR